jgi:UDP-N-acetylglucosamine--N-acetylmuramyl-(pentapeptide) pyrophosphoryl-undecaprenol N-acetylglucosamine transferase
MPSTTDATPVPPRLILLSGGGTGGHVYPAVAVAEALRRRWPDARLVFVGVEGRAEAAILPRLGHELRSIPAVGMPPLHDLPGQVRFLWVLGAGIRAAGALLRELRPDAVVGTGGYASAPVLLAALGTPIPRRKRPVTVIHEQNAVPGKLNRFVGRRVDRVAVTYPESLAWFPKRTAVHVGYPLRHDIARIDRVEARARFGIPADGFVVLAFGGSLGARTINRAIAHALPELLGEPDLWILHGTGRSGGAGYDPGSDTAGIVAALDLAPAHRVRYLATDFLDPIADAYAAADLVVSRAGAGTLAEIQACGLPAVVLPKVGLPGDHQVANARAMESAGAATMIVETEHEDPRDGRIASASPTELTRRILGLKREPERLRVMGDRARGLHVPGAADRIVEEVAALLRAGDRS